MAKNDHYSNGQIGETSFSNGQARTANEHDEKIYSQLAKLYRWPAK
jgi:hypothetical protein